MNALCRQPRQVVAQFLKYDHDGQRIDVWLMKGLSMDLGY